MPQVQIPASVHCFRSRLRILLRIQSRKAPAGSDNPFHIFRISPDSKPFQPIAFKGKKIPIKQAPAIPIKANCAYFGLATKIRITPIPRIMIAVLKLLAPTSPTIGRIQNMILQSVHIFPIVFTFFVTRSARKESVQLSQILMAEKKTGPKLTIFWTR